MDDHIYTIEISRELPITKSEWAKLIDDDPELLRVERAKTVTATGQEVEVNFECAARWLKSDTSNDAYWLFEFKDGRIEADLLEHNSVEKASSIAVKLGGQIKVEQI